MLQKDCSRLAGENNQLHLRLIKETEHSDRREREHYTQLKVGLFYLPRVLCSSCNMHV